MDDKKYNSLDPHLQRVLRSKVSLQQDEIKQINEYLCNILKNNLLPEMKEVDPTFKELYSKENYTGSYYENLRVGTPDEFDLNLVLKLPAESFTLQESQPGFVEIQTVNWSNKDTLRKVLIDNQGFILRTKVIRWLQGVVDKALRRISIPNFKLSRSTHGPAITLDVKDDFQTFSIDLVPVFVFCKDKWPKPPVRQPSFYHQEGWCVVPKAPTNATENERIWRMSFYSQEKTFLNGTNNLKPILKLLKLLRDREGWHCLASYYIKTVFLWEHTSDSQLSTKSLGFVFIYMLRKLKVNVREKEIPFFWDKRHNLLQHAINDHQSTNIANRIEAILNIIDRNVDKNPEIINIFFKPHQSQDDDQTNQFNSHHEPNNYQSQSQETQQEHDYGALITGVTLATAAVAAAAVAVGTYFWSNRKKQ